MIYNSAQARAYEAHRGPGNGLDVFAPCSARLKTANAGGSPTRPRAAPQCIRITRPLSSCAAQLLWLLAAHPEARRPALLANASAVVAYLPWRRPLADFNSPTTTFLSAITPFDLSSCRHESLALVNRISVYLRRYCGPERAAGRGGHLPASHGGRSGWLPPPAATDANSRSPVYPRQRSPPARDRSGPPRQSAKRSPAP